MSPPSTKKTKEDSEKSTKPVKSRPSTSSENARQKSVVAGANKSVTTSGESSQAKGKKVLGSSQGAAKKQKAKSEKNLQQQGSNLAIGLKGDKSDKGAEGSKGNKPSKQKVSKAENKAEGVKPKKPGSGSKIKSNEKAINTASPVGNKPHHSRFDDVRVEHADYPKVMSRFRAKNSEGKPVMGYFISKSLEVSTVAVPPAGSWVYRLGDLAVFMDDNALKTLRQTAEGRIRLTVDEKGSVVALLEAPKKQKTLDQSASPKD